MVSVLLNPPPPWTREDPTGQEESADPAGPARRRRTTPVLAAVDDSSLAPRVVERAVAAALVADCPLLVATVFVVRPDSLLSPLDATLEAYDGALATLDRVRPQLERCGVPFTAEVRGCSGRGGARRHARRVANQLLRLRAEAGAGVVVLGTWQAGRSPGAIGARIVRALPVDVEVAFAAPRPVPVGG
jgi:hypothetical protein